MKKCVIDCFDVFCVGVREGTEEMGSPDGYKYDLIRTEYINGSGFTRSANVGTGGVKVMELGKRFRRTTFSGGAGQIISADGRDDWARVNGKRKPRVRIRGRAHRERGNPRYPGTRYPSLRL